MIVSLVDKILYLSECGYTQYEIAEIIGCGQSTVSMMKAGYTPNNQRIEKKN